VTGAKEMALMTPHEEHYPHPPTFGDENRWGAMTLLLSTVAIALIGVLVLTSSV
jgi:hypothetical protein